jgi:predicted  nucleic acid-binding Zn-ribbon protein
MDISTASKKRKLHDSLVEKQNSGKYKKLKLRNAHERELESILSGGEESSDDSLSGFYTDKDDSVPATAAEQRPLIDYAYQRTPVQIADQLREEKESLEHQVSESRLEIERLNAVNESLSREIARAPDPRDVDDLRRELATNTEALRLAHDKIRQLEKEAASSSLDPVSAEEQKLQTENKMLVAHNSRLAKDNSKLELDLLELKEVANVTESEARIQKSKDDDRIKELEDEICDLKDKIEELVPPDTTEKAISVYGILARFSRNLVKGEVVIIRPEPKAARKHGGQEYWYGRVVNFDAKKQEVEVEYAVENPYGGYMPFQYNYKSKKTPTEVISAKHVYATAKGLPVLKDQHELFNDAVKRVMDNRIHLAQGEMSDSE